MDTLDRLQINGPLNPTSNFRQCYLGIILDYNLRWSLSPRCKLLDRAFHLHMSEFFASFLRHMLRYMLNIHSIRSKLNYGIIISIIIIRPYCYRYITFESTVLTIKFSSYIQLEIKRPCKVYFICHRHFFWYFITFYSSQMYSHEPNFEAFSIFWRKKIQILFESPTCKVSNLICCILDLAGPFL